MSSEPNPPPSLSRLQTSASPLEIEPPSTRVGLVVIASEHFDHALLCQAAAEGQNAPTGWYDKADVWTTDALRTLYGGQSVLWIQLNDPNLREGDAVLELACSFLGHNTLQAGDPATASAQVLQHWRSPLEFDVHSL